MVPSALLLDTSAAVALLLEGHMGHDATLDAVRGHELGLSGHAVFEAMSVLSRLPGTSRRPIAVVHEALTRSFPHSRYLSTDATAALPAELASLGIAGGAIFDAMVGAAAREHGIVLVTRDTRARAVYHALGVELLIVP